MAWLAVDKDGSEWICSGNKPHRCSTVFFSSPDINGEEATIKLPKDSIKKLIGRELSWKDEPVELEEE